MVASMSSMVGELISPPTVRFPVITTLSGKPIWIWLSVEPSVSTSSIVPIINKVSSGELSPE